MLFMTLFAFPAVAGEAPPATVTGTSETVISEVALAQSPPAQVTSLAGQWKLHPGDNLHWARPSWDDSQWADQAVPGKWPKQGFDTFGQMVWYRLRVSPQMLYSIDTSLLGLRIGAIRSAYEVYVGGHYLGGIGALPPAPRISYDKLAVYPIPKALLNEDGSLVIALRVWGGSDLGVRKAGGGAYNGKFLLGNYSTLLRELSNEQLPNLILAILFLTIGLYFVYLYSRNHRLQSFAWFGSTAIVLAVYVITQSQWKYALHWPFILLEKIEAVTFYLFVALFIQLIWTVVDQSIGRILRLYQLSFVGAALVVAAIPGIAIHHYMRTYLQLSVLPIFLLTYWLVIQKARSGHREAKTLLIGLLIYGVSAINDLLINMQVIHSVPVVQLGFLAVLVSMAVTLADRFTGLLDSLDRKVNERTAELEIANERLEKLSKIDPLTQLLNRRGFVDEAHSEISRYIRMGRPFTIVLSDIDYFKRVNDEFGHASGDFVLQKIAAIMQEQLREVDRVGRWGGEEFVMLLPETDAEGALKIAEKLRLGITQATIENNSHSFNVTMTFGVAQYSHAEGLEKCIARADAALYRGKSQGRNTVTIAG